MKRKDSILQNYYYSKLPRAQDGLENYGLPSARELARQNQGYSSDAPLVAKMKADAKAAEEAKLINMRKKQGEIRQGKPKRSTASKALAILTNPVTALSYKVKGQDIPENFERGKLNPYEYVLNMVNPFGYVNAAASVPGDIARGEYLQAGLNTAAVLPMLSELRGLRGAKGVTPKFISSEPVITRGPINYWEEPTFAKNNPRFKHERYVNSVNKFGTSRENTDPRLLDFKEYDIEFEDGGGFDEEAFQKFRQTLPLNLRIESPGYNLRGYWEALGKPLEFDYSQPKEEDGYYHAFSRNPQTGEILKKPGHPTFKMAIKEDRKAGYFPIVTPEGTIKTVSGRDYKAYGGNAPVEHQDGQYMFPGIPTRIRGKKITMNGLNQPLVAKTNHGITKLLLPNVDYEFDPTTQFVDEHPIPRIPQVSNRTPMVRRDNGGESYPGILNLSLPKVRGNRGKVQINPYIYYERSNPNVSVYGAGFEGNIPVTRKFNMLAGSNMGRISVPRENFSQWMKPSFNVGVGYRFRKGGMF